MTTVEALEKAKALIDTPEKWCKGASARDDIGSSVHPQSKEAQCFCMLGALDLLEDQNAGDNAYTALTREISSISGADDVQVFNDAPKTTHADVMAAFDRAIEAARREEV